MLALLKNSFPGTKNKLQSARGNHEPELLDNPNFINEPEQILCILNKIKSDGLLCSLNLDNKGNRYTTSLIRVHAQEEYIILDEISSDSGKQIFTAGSNIKLSVFYNEINLCFSLSSLELVSSHDNAYYKAALPKSIYYPQRRASRRIPLNSCDISFQGISVESQIPIWGNVDNISRSGIGVTFHNNNAPIERGKKLTDCRVLLPENYVFNFDLSIRFAKQHDLYSKTTRIGGYFENISPERQKKLERYVAMLERKEIRQLKVDS